MRFEEDSRGPGRVIDRRKKSFYGGMAPTIRSLTSRGTYTIKTPSARTAEGQRRMAEATKTRRALGIKGPQDYPSYWYRGKGSGGRKR